MPSLASAAVLLAASAAVVNAHFTLDYPPTIGFSDDDEGTGPCGSFTPDFSKDNVTDFHVGGDNIAIHLLHPQGTWFYRATLDETAASNNWTQLFPEIQQTGLGKFCEPLIPAPESWVGQKGVIGVVVDGPDGLLYQCAAVNFVAGAATMNQTTCTNSTGVTAKVVTDPKLASLAAGNDTAGPESSAAPASSGMAMTSAASGTAMSGTAMATMTGTSTASTASASTKSAASGRVGGSVSLGGAGAVVLAAMLGSAYMLM
ncbi:hypothetical protein SEPCBS119000_002461 [Sporothrix epigloea]|uniref:Copper acquisition factor BIM1-like domain-containing protein n=1 Tax=Sporothrix epigloea TaxID=1892477 RepID=A0ABP0DG97_9PEZI